MVQCSIFLAFRCPVAPVSFVERLSFFHAIALHLCQKPVGPVCVALSWAPLFCPTDPYQYHSCDYCSCVVSLDIGYINSSHFILFQNRSIFKRTLPFHINFRIITFTAIKTLAGILIGIDLNAIYQIGKN